MPLGDDRAIYLSKLLGADTRVCGLTNRVELLLLRRGRLNLETNIKFIFGNVKCMVSIGQRFLTGVPHEFLKCAIPDYLVRGH